MHTNIFLCTQFGQKDRIDTFKSTPLLTEDLAHKVIYVCMRTNDLPSLTAESGSIGGVIYGESFVIDPSANSTNRHSNNHTMMGGALCLTLGIPRMFVWPAAGSKCNICLHFLNSRQVLTQISIGIYLMLIDESRLVESTMPKLLSICWNNVRSCISVFSETFSD